MQHIGEYECNLRDLLFRWSGSIIYAKKKENKIKLFGNIVSTFPFFPRCGSLITLQLERQECTSPRRKKITQLPGGKISVQRTGAQ